MVATDTARIGTAATATAGIDMAVTGMAVTDTARIGTAVTAAKGMAATGIADPDSDPATQTAGDGPHRKTGNMIKALANATVGSATGTTGNVKAAATAIPKTKTASSSDRHSQARRGHR
jgi:hypothetical protein